MASRPRHTPTVPVSEELMAPLSKDVELCYQTFGSPQDEPLLLVMGLGGPMNWWDPEFCSTLAGRGFYVIRYDNRDTGRSSRARGRVTRSMLVRAFTGRRVRAPYSLEDMAADACGLLDHLGLDSAHVVGVSMGGMIAQTMAITAPERVRSLTSIMSTTGKRTVGWQHPSLLPSLLMSRGPGREAYIATSTAVWKMIGSPGYPPDAESIANRAARLRAVTVPTLVIHGVADKMVHASGGRATAAAIPDAELLLIDGMGHDLPPALFSTFIDAIERTTRRA